MAVAAVVAIVAVGGIGFASFTATAYLNGSGSAGTIQLQWGPDPSSAPSVSYATCSAVVGETYAAGDTLTVTAGNLAPGNYCTFSDSLNDIGTLPGTTYSQLTTVTGTGGCSWWVIDTYGTHTYPPEESPLGPISISPSTPIAYSLAYGLTDGNAGCAGATLSTTLVFTATAGS